MEIQLSDECIPYRSMSPTLYDLLGIPEGIVLPSKQDISILDLDAYLKVSTPAKSPDTVDEDKAIQMLLQGGLTLEQIIDFVRIYRVSKEAGNHEALDIILGVQTDELLERIHRVGQYIQLDHLAKLTWVRDPSGISSAYKLEHICIHSPAHIHQAYARAL
jgi:hypothetical protein